MIYNIFPILFCINQISNNNNFKKDFYYVENKILDELHKQKQGGKLGSYWSNTGESWWWIIPQWSGGDGEKWSDLEYILKRKTSRTYYWWTEESALSNTVVSH